MDPQSVSEEHVRPRCLYCSVADRAYIIQCSTCKLYFCNSTAYAHGNGKTHGKSHILQHVYTARHCYWELGSFWGDRIPAFTNGANITASKRRIADENGNNKAGESVMLSHGEECVQLQDWFCPTDSEAAMVPWSFELAARVTPDDYQLLEEYFSLFRSASGTAETMLQHPERFRKWRKKVTNPRPITGSVRVGTYQSRLLADLIDLRLLDKSVVANLPPIKLRRLQHRWGSTIMAKLEEGFRYREFTASQPPVSLKHVLSANEYYGNISSLEDQTVTVDLTAGDDTWNTHLDPSDQWGMTLLFKTTAYDRMESALKAAASAMHPRVKEVILHPALSRVGNVKYQEVLPNAPFLPGGCFEPNSMQKIAIQMAVNNHFTLIQGPPGTGKTRVAALIAYAFLYLHPEASVLCCAPSNQATDQMCVAVNEVFSRPHKLNAEILRLLAPYRDPNLVPQVLTDAHIVFNANEQGCRQTIEASSVICVTCNSSAVSVLNKKRFSLLILDECNQALEPEALIPMTRAIPQVVLLGDTKLLSPPSRYTCMKQSPLNTSLFERLWSHLVNHGDKYCVALHEQYRMHPRISHMVSTVSYSGQLTDRTTTEKRQVPLLDEIAHSRQSPQMVFVHVPSNAKPQRASKKSGWPSEESHIIARIVTNLLTLSENGTRSRNKRSTDNRKAATLPTLASSQIGVIGFHTEQKETLLRHISAQTRLSKVKLSKDELHDMVNSVESFQGQERDVMLLSCVWSAGVRFGYRRADYLDDAQRLNVAMSRARCWIIAVGDWNVFSDPQRCQNWPKYLAHFRVLHWKAPGVDAQPLLRVRDDQLWRPLRLRLKCPNIDPEKPCDICPHGTSIAGAAVVE